MAVICALLLTASANARDPATEFEGLYAAWHRECAAVAFSSSVKDYVGLPSYRKMVALGEAAVPFLRVKLVEDADGDFMLASAIAEIYGWDRSDFRGASEQAFRDWVLRRLAASH